MSIRESALTAITSITNADLIRAVTSAGASRRITVANLAKHFIENYASSSLAGSVQSVKAAIDSIGSDSNTSVTATPSTGLTLGTTKSINAIKRGHVGMLQFNVIIAGASASTTYTLCTLPAGYQPAIAGQAIRVAQNGVVYIVSWATDGTVSLYFLSAISSNVFIRDVVPLPL